LPGPDIVTGLPITFSVDDPVTGIGKVSMQTVSGGYHVARPSGQTIGFSIGDYQAWCGPWSVDHQDLKGCPQHAIYPGADNWPVAGDWASVKQFIADYQIAINGGLDTTNPLWDVEALTALTGLAALFNLGDDNVSPDDARCLAAANPHGGTTFGDIDTNCVALSNNPYKWVPYTITAAIPHHGTGITLAAVDVGIATPGVGGEKAINGSVKPWNTVGNLIADPLVVIEGAGVNADGDDVCFPLFVYWTGAAWELSLYQPQLLTDGDSGSAQWLVKPGLLAPGYQVGHVHCGNDGTLHIASASMPIGMPDAVEKTSVYCTEMNPAYDGIYGNRNGTRPVHDLIAIAPLAAKAGEGGISVWQLGPSYSNLPSKAGDWWVTGFHGNIVDDVYKLTSMSLGHNVDSSGFVENTLFQQPGVAIQWSDGAGLGFNPGSVIGPDLKGYRYTNSATLGQPAAAYVDTTQGGETLSPIIDLPTFGSSIKLWEYEVDNAGILITAGRFLGSSANYGALVSTSPGPLFLTRPTDVEMNLYFNWLGDTDEVIPRYGFLFG